MALMISIDSPARAARRLVVPAICAVLAGCGGDGPTEGVPRGEPGLRVVAGGQVQDTVSFVSPQAIVVRVHGVDGKPASGMLVRFKAVRIRGWHGTEVPSAWVGPLATNSWSETSEDTTNARGEVSVRLSLGPVAGAASVIASAPALGYADTARFTVEPGAAAKLIAEPRDTAVYAGGAYTLRMRVTDRLGNPRQDPVTLAPARGVSVEGTQIRGNDVGRTYVVTQVTGIRDSVWVSVVPRGTIAARDADGIVLFELDGSGFRRVLLRGGVERLSWAPSGEQLAFGANNRVWVTDLQGTNRAVAVPGVNNFHGVYAPSYSRDGRWIYFNSLEETYYWRSEFIWRVRPDGSGMERVTPTGVTENPGEQFPSLSPDGSRLALYSYDHVRVRNLATRGVSLAVRGTNPRWSPVSDQIAFWSQGRIMLTAADGTGLRNLSPDTPVGTFDWSPDGRWLITRLTRSQLALIHAQTGEIIPLPYSSGWDVEYPVWK